MDAAAFDTARRAFEAGLAAQQAGRLAEAEAHYRRSLATLPGRPSTLTNLGATLLAQGRPAEALPLLQQAGAAAPTNAEAWAHAGEALLALARPAEALNAYAAALALPAAPPRAALRHAECLARLGRLPEALGEARALCGRLPDWAEAWALAGSLHRDLGHADEAGAALQRALALDGDDAVSAWLLAGLRGAHDADAPPLPPPGYVASLFDGYAAEFDQHLESLEYRVPELLLPGLVGRRYARALDLGCGTGLVGRLVRPMVDVLEGLDVSTAMLERARATGAYDALHAAELLAHLQQQAAASLDLVLSADVFIYLGELDPVFAAVRRALAPGGVFAFSVESAPAGSDVALLPTARYAHGSAYLQTLASRHGLVHARTPEATTLRLEQRRPVAGQLWWLAVPAA
jgi:predicted TPR repeat methyltransferase